MMGTGATGPDRPLAEDESDLAMAVGANGVLPRTLDAIFARINDKAHWAADQHRHSFQIEMTFVEVYMENIRDLLTPRHSNTCTELKKLYPGPAAHCHCGGLSLNLIGEDVKGAARVTVSTPAEGLRLVRTALRNRRTARTLWNDTSSRSHALCALHVTHTIETREGKEVSKSRASMQMVDLAGSEACRNQSRTSRVSNASIFGNDAAQASEDKRRAQEGSAINRSLLTLAAVVKERSSEQRGRHLPFRESKLTMLLRGALSGSGRTVIVLNASMHEKDTPHTLSTLEVNASSTTFRMPCLVWRKPQHSPPQTHFTLL
jgi:centromeric protein E